MLKQKVTKMELEKKKKVESCNRELGRRTSWQDVSLIATKAACLVMWSTCSVYNTCKDCNLNGEMTDSNYDNIHC